MDCKVKALIKNSVYQDILEIVSSDIDWKKFSGKTILITGAGGFIGYYLSLAFLLRNDLYSENIKVIALVRNKSKAQNKFGDLLNRDDLVLCVQDVNESISCQKADYVIHMASQASNIQFENDPVGTINANLSGTANVLDFAQKSCSEAVLIVSSLKVYGTVFKGDEKIKEEDLGYIDFTSYKNCYAMGKRASETLAASYVKQYGMNIKIARPSYIYGASSLDDDRVWAQFIANVVKNEDILLKSNGVANRSFCYVSDTASALLYIMLNGVNSVPYNISNEKSDTTIRNFAKTACDVFPERNIKLSFANKEDEFYDTSQKSVLAPTAEILDNSKILALGWIPKVDLAEGIKRSVKILEEK